MRVGLLLVALIYVAGALFGIDAPFLWGHHGYHGATYMLRAIMTLRFHIVTPANWAGYEYPPRFSWYFHHPIGYHHLLVPFVWLFGAREWVARGFASVWGLPLLWTLYVLVRRHWSRGLGLLGTAVFVAMPFVTQYEILLDPIFPTMACTLVALDAFLRYWESPQRKYLIWACAAFVGAGLLMWDGYFEAFFLGFVAFAFLATKRGRAARLLEGEKVTNWSAQLCWIFWTGLFSALTMAFHFVFTWGVGMMSDFRASYHQRHASTLEYVYGREKEWAQILFGKPLLMMGGLWLAIFFLRVLAGQARKRDLAVWIFLINKTFYIYLFREAAAVHEYRVDWYLFFLTFAVVDLVSDLGACTRYFLHRIPTLADRAEGIAGAAMLIAGLAWLCVEAPAGYHKLVESRETMGTDTPAYNSDYPKQAFAMEIARRTGPRDYVFTLTTGFPRRIEFYFYMDRSNVDIFSLNQLTALRKEHPRSLLILNPNALSPSERQTLLGLLAKYPADIYDGYMVVDFRSEKEGGGGKPGIREYTFVPQKTGPLYRYFVSHKYPPMKPAPRATNTLECLYAQLGIAVPADVPAPAPFTSSSPEEAVCRHDYLMLRGDKAGADKVIERLRGTLFKEDVALGAGARVVAARIESRRGVDVWLRLDQPKVLPAALGLRLRLHPETKGSDVVVETRVTRRLFERPAGSLDFERLSPPAIAPGPYRATLELVDYAISVAKPVVPKPPAPSADLGRLEIR